MLPEVRQGIRGSYWWLEKIYRHFTTVKMDMAANQPEITYGKEDKDYHARQCMWAQHVYKNENV